MMIDKNVGIILKASVAFLLVTSLTACSTKLPEDAGVHEYSGGSDGYLLPQRAFPEPNTATYSFYTHRYLNDHFGFTRYVIRESKNPKPLNAATSENAYLDAEINKGPLLSYLFYADGEVIYDALIDDDERSFYLDDNTPLVSWSVGKSLTSFLLGHAICDGFIEGLDQDISGWPLVKNTVYEDQKLIDLVNMRAGDSHIVSDKGSFNGFYESDRHPNLHSLSSFRDKELRNTKPTRRAWNYNGLVTNVVLNYIIYRVPGSFEEWVNEVFNEDIRNGNVVWMLKNRVYDERDGNARYVFYASRYDYLRIGIRMLEHWNDDTCVGDYLKEVYERGELLPEADRPALQPIHVHKYGGFFWSGYQGLRNRNILGMNGYGGQNVIVDFDNNRVVVTNSVHVTYDWKALIFDAIKHGKILK
jgi:CubicO group peptidase (beta-lactamase class C family)